jgi:hypothetical protein
VLNHVLQLCGEYGGYRLTSGLFAQGNGSFERLQAPEAGDAPGDMSFDFAAPDLVHLSVDVLR